MAPSSTATHSLPAGASAPGTPGGVGQSSAAALEVLADQAVEDLGRRVAEARHSAGLTLAAVAARSGLSPAYISQMESGIANPTARALAQVAAGLELSLGELFGSGVGEERAQRRFEPRFATVPRVATAAGAKGIWDLTAMGSSRLHGRLVHGAPGDHADPVHHAGEEFLVVLAGQCQLRVGGLVRRLKAADGCHFAATDLHQITDVSDDLLLIVILSEE
jgi:transcriptional regulator with XRE-family HTH domain